MTSNPESVQVAVRIRPLVEIEKKAGYQLSLQGFPESNQVQFINSDKGFTFNYVFDELTNQQIFYEKCVQPMLDKLYKGYNVTILAYGQTGSGKTHSMGTAYDGTGEMGVIPRAIYDIFNYVNTTNDYESKITVSFMELYQENLYDLLADRPRDQCVVDIRDDGNKGIRVPSLTEIPVTTIEDTIKCLIGGSSGRATGATAMNAQSSRSHAIFTITLYMQKKDDNNTATTSKFHLVDLAGSERSKKTKAIGERFKEGVNINIGLLALGNVISALGEGQKYISYRDSKLTRLLQDSLGGNSLTLMIACVSPADYNIEETLSTLRYADRARKIKNKPVVNQDPLAAEISRLQQIIQQLRCEKLVEGSVTVNSEEFEKLKEEIIRQQKRNRELNTALSSALTENTCMFERALLTQTANERLQKKLLELKETYNVTLSNLNSTINNEQQEPNSKTILKDQVGKLEYIKSMMEDLETEHKKNEEELQKHEQQSTTPRINRHLVDHDLHSSEPDLDAKQEKHTTEQLNLNNELKELNRVLAIKEQLATQMMANANHLHIVDHTSIEENQEKIFSLEKEKDDLLQQLKSVQSHTININSNSNLNACSKISEQRRKRVKELETQISELNRKVQEQGRLIKLKEKDEAKIRLLNNEIQSMKAAKVKLIKTMRSEEQKFREWKVQREKELMRLKDQDRKRQNQMIRMENMHCKQQNVLKRKVEEAAAINKRLKDALALQKQAQERRALNSGKSERVEQWVEQEFEVMIRTLEAERTREQLFDDRASLMEALNKIQADDEYVNTEKGQNHVKQLNEHIELRHAQINDLHQKIMDSDQESKSKTRFDIIQSMVDAKCALRKLFDLAANIRKKSIVNDYKLEEVNSAFEDAQNKLSTYEKQLSIQESEHKHKLSELEKEYEEKISVVLRQLRQTTPDTNDESLKERLRIQEEALEKMDELRKEVECYKEEVHSLRDKMNQVNQCEKKKKPPSKSKILTSVYKEDIIGGDTSIELVPTDDEDNDPDWMNTPLYKRMMSGLQQDGPVKRSSDGTIKCSCKGNCSSKLCGCRKKNNVCSDQCNCVSENCLNRGGSSQFQNSVARKIFENDDSSEDSFKKPLGERNGDDCVLRPKRSKNKST